MARVRIETEGEGVVLDAADPSAFIEAVGSRYVATEGPSVLYRGGDGHLARAWPGWVAVVPEDGSRTVVATPDLVRPA